MQSNAELLIEHCNKLLQVAKRAHPTNEYVTYEDYYYGKFNDTIRYKNLSNDYNITKSIVDTKATFILDNHITTSVVPKTIRNANWAAIEDMSRVADILEDCKNHVFELNKVKSLKSKVILRAQKTNVGIVKIGWDAELSDGLGDVSLEEINPQNFFPDPEAKDIQECNYIFIKRSYSLFSLKEKYPDRLKDIQELMTSQKTDKKSLVGEAAKKIRGIVSYQNDNNTGQMFAYDTEGIQAINETITVWECYLKDTSTYDEEVDQTDGPEKEFVRRSKLKYPNGRYIVYAGDDKVFEDKQLEEPFYPFSVYKDDIGDIILSPGGVIRYIKNIQDRINRGYERAQFLIGSYLSTVIFDGACGVHSKEEIINAPVLTLSPNSLAKGLMPQILTNNTLGELTTLMQYLEQLKKDAQDMSRVNQMMMTGARQEGVSSGEMVDALNESPMVSIRDSQRNFMDFMVDLTDKIIVFIQMHYTQSRIIRITTGEEKYIRLPLIGQDGERRGGIEVFRPKENNEAQRMEQIDTDLREGQYKTEVIAGTELPRSRTQTSRITMELAAQGFFGDPNSLEVKKQILTSLDYPNRRAIIDRLEEEEQKGLQEPVPTPSPLQYMKEMSIGFKDLENFPEAQAKILTELGLLNPPPPPEPLPEEMPLGIEPEMPLEEQALSGMPIPGGI